MAQDCTHRRTELRIRTFKDGTRHLQEQCLDCLGAVGCFVKRAGPISEYRDWVGRAPALRYEQLEMDLPDQEQTLSNLKVFRTGRNRRDKCRRNDLRVGSEGGLALLGGVDFLAPPPPHPNPNPTPDTRVPAPRPRPASGGLFTRDSNWQPRKNGSTG